MTGKEIVVGLDGSEPARAALRWAADQARLSGSTLRALYVSDWPTGVRADGRPLVPEDLVMFEDGDLERADKKAITELFRTIDPEDSWSLEFAVGKAGRALVDRSKDAHLLVVGTGEHVGLGRVLLGSTSHYCLSHASCPVVAVPAIHGPLTDEPAPM